MIKGVIMKAKEIYQTIKDLAKSQGFYGRVLRAIEEDGIESRNERLEFLEKQGFKDKVDLVLYFES